MKDTLTAFAGMLVKWTSEAVEKYPKMKLAVVAVGLGLALAFAISCLF